MVDVEAVILDELGRLAPLRGYDGADWTDVLRRATPQPGATTWPASSRRPIYVALAVLVLAAAIVAPAVAFREQIIDFFTASHAPKNVVVYFNRLQAFQSAPPGVSPGLFPARARRITSVRVNGKKSVLYIAPTKRDGFCVLWTSNYVPRCLAQRPRSGSSRYGNFSWSSFQPALGVDSVEGEIFVQHASLDVLYADGVKAAIPYVWVTAPISAGFFLYGIPDDRRLGKVRPVALTVSVNGKTILRQPIGDVSKSSHFVNRTDRWGQSIQVPSEAVWSKRRLLYSFNTADGRLIELWVAPSRLSPRRRCVISTTSVGCEPIVLSGSPMRLRLFGGGRGPANVLLTGEVADKVTRIELRFQDGSRQTISPKQGIVLAKLALRHDPLGLRLVSAIGLDERGSQVASTRFEPKQPDVYPCTKPKDYGYGVLRCP